MFATLVGTNTNNVSHSALFERLCDIATAHGFAPPDTPTRIRPDGPLDGWALNQRGPADGRAEFFLAVTAPRIPGMSPIFPVLKTISGPLFAVIVLESAFVVSREDQRDVQETKDEHAVSSAFREFLGGLRR